MTSIQVSVRVRPFNGRETKYGSRLIINMDGPLLEVTQVKQGKITNEAPRKFTFDHCFWTHDGQDTDKWAGQQFVYDQLGKTILDNSLSGFNSCLFAYGQTGSGKTYSMMGIPSDSGVIPRLCVDLFQRAEDIKDTHVVAVECSYLEIYNEQIRDLLNPVQDKPLKARQHPKLGVYVENLTKLSASSEAEISKFIDDGAMVRSVASTNMNAQSSRSHAILTLSIRKKGKDNELASQLHLVDLAGSERATSTGASGDTLVEGANINKSLTTLGMCLSRLAETADGKKGHIPFRDSQLTWLLNDSLGGNSKTAMLANISPADINFEETLSTLRFAATTKKIKNHAVVNEDPQQRLIRELRAEIALIKEQIAAFDAGQPIPTNNQLSSNATGGGEGPHEGAAGDDGEEGAEQTRSPDRGSGEEGGGEGTDGGSMEDEPDAMPDAESLTRQLSENMQLMMEAVQSQEERDKKDKQLKADREMAMAALQKQQEEEKAQKKEEKAQAESNTLSVDHSLPRLITLNEDLHSLPTIAILYYLNEGTNRVGTDKDSLVQLPPTAASKESLLQNHFCFECNLEEHEVRLVLPSEKPAQEAEVEVEGEAATDTVEGGAASKTEGKPPTSTKGLDSAVVYVNGTPLLPEVNGPLDTTATTCSTNSGVDDDVLRGSVILKDLDRIVVGQLAFRHSQPSSWRVQRDGLSMSREDLDQSFAPALDRDEFSRNWKTVQHLTAVESHDRPKVEIEYFDGIERFLASVKSKILKQQSALEETEGVQQPDGDGPSGEEGTPQGPAQLEAFSTFVDALSEGVVEEKRLAAYHAAEAEEHLVQEYPLSAEEEEALLTEAAQNAASDNAGLKYDYHFAMNEKAAYLKRKEQEAKAKEREEALSLLATQSEAKNAEIDQLKEELRLQEEASAALKMKRESISVGASGGGSGGAGSPASVPLVAPTSSAQEKIKLAAELADYEELCRETKLWKPAGPSIEEHQAEYKFAVGLPTLGGVRGCPHGGDQSDVVMELNLQKYRVKKGLFSRSGYHPVFVVIRRHYLYYFENDKDATKASGSIYLWGCEMQDVLKHEKAADGRQHCLRLIPCVPRKTTKGTQGVTEENNVVFNFPSQQDLESFKQHLGTLAMPVIPPRVAEYMSSMGIAFDS